MLKHLKTNNQGIIFVAVLSIILVMMIITISIMSINVSQSVVAEAEIRHIQSQVVGMGAITLGFANQLITPSHNIMDYNVKIGDTWFNVVINKIPNIGPLGTNSLNIVVSY